MSGSAAQGFGRFEGKTHILPVRIYYEDTDLSGVVYHANYLRYMERGRSEFFRCAGIHQLARLDDEEPTAWTLRRIAIIYHRPARVDDLIEVHTRCAAITGARMNADQTVHCRGQVLMEGKVEACVITLTGKPRRIPQEWRNILGPLVTGTDL